MADPVAIAVGTNTLAAGMVSGGVGDVEASATDPLVLSSRLRLGHMSLDLGLRAKAAARLGPVGTVLAPVMMRPGW